MTSGDRQALTSAIERLGVLGPFFAAELHDPAEPVSAPWQEMSAVLTDPAILSARVRAGRESLAARSGRTVDGVAPRVAASVIHLGLVARTLSPAWHSRSSTVGADRSDSQVCAGNRPSAA